MHPSPGPATAPPGLSLSGPDAADWFAARGLLLDEPAGVHLFVEEADGEGFRLRRLRHTRTRLRWARTAGAPLVAVPLDTGLRMEAAGSSASIDATEVVVLPPGAEADLVALRSTARYEIEIDGSLPRALRGHARHLTASPAFRAVFLSAATAALGSGIDADGVGAASFRSVMTQLTIGLLLTTHDTGTSGRPPRSVDLFEAARDVIVARAADPDFSVGELAAELHLSQDYLFRVFRRHGTTPAREIRAARLALARLHAVVDGRPRPAGEVARLSGFRSANTLRRVADAAQR